MVRIAITLLMIAFSFSAAAQTPDTIGSWTGKASQNKESEDYIVNLTITAEGGKSDYPALKCGGTLTRIATSHGYDFYYEKITYGGVDSGGDCIDGTITVSPAGRGLAWGWVGTFRGEVFVSWGDLQRK